jgi:hypothetical protein
MLARRSFLKLVLTGGAAVPVCAGLSRVVRADEPIPLLKESDFSAQTIAYVEDATKVDAKAYPAFKPGQTCANCSQYVADKGASKGACALVLGQYVLARGWCKAWEPVPAKKP